MNLLVSRHASNLNILPGPLCEADRSERFSPMNLVKVFLGLDTSQGNARNSIFAAKMGSERLTNAK